MSMRYRCIIAQWDWGLGGLLDHHQPSRTGSCDNRNINRRIFLYFVDFRIFVCVCIYHLHIKSIFLLLLFVEVRNCYFLKLVVIWRCLETKYCYLAKYLWEMDYENVERARKYRLDRDQLVNSGFPGKQVHGALKLFLKGQLDIVFISLKSLRN